jgi:Na+-transporting NADH:ubiquinone oxidoreductase subunit C
MKKDSIAYVMLFSILVCVAFVLPLAVANELTKPMVEVNRLFAARSAVLAAFDLAGSASTPAEVEVRFSENIRSLPAPEGLHGTSKAWEATIDGTRYIAVQQSGPGLWGGINLILAADEKAARTRGLAILDQQETPGLGGRIDESWFKDQFSGEKTGAGGKIDIVQGGSGEGDQDKENGRVDAIAGASRTSDMLEAIVGAALDSIRALGGRP